MVYYYFSAHGAPCLPNRIFALVLSRGGEAGQNLNHEGLSAPSFLTSSVNQYFSLINCFMAS